MKNTLSWQDFCNELIENDYIYEFKYNDKFIYIGAEVKGFFKKSKQWIFAVHKHDKKGNEIFAVYKTPQLLLNNARVDGHSLNKIWDELSLNN